MPPKPLFIVFLLLLLLTAAHTFAPASIIPLRAPFQFSEVHKASTWAKYRCSQSTTRTLRLSPLGETKHKADLRRQDVGQSTRENRARPAADWVVEGQLNDVTESLKSRSNGVEFALLVTWGTGISAFVLVNNYIGPWPEHLMSLVPERAWFLAHMVSSMIFGGGIMLTTVIERLVVNSKNASVLQFWFEKVPMLDGLVVLPALTIAMISGTGLATNYYGGLGASPEHIRAAFYALNAFALWWATTDLTSEEVALPVISKWAEEEDQPVPPTVKNRGVSNVVSCFFVVLLYGIMVLKPFTVTY